MRGCEWLRTVKPNSLWKIHHRKWRIVCLTLLRPPFVQRYFVPLPGYAISGISLFAASKPHAAFSRMTRIPNRAWARAGATCMYTLTRRLLPNRALVLMRDSIAWQSKAAPLVQFRHHAFCRLTTASFHIAFSFNLVSAAALFTRSQPAAYIRLSCSCCRCCLQSFNLHYTCRQRCLPSA
jgi:hypothetical protein